jgi:tRNA (guanine37-N1)-methyltransferase
MANKRVDIITIFPDLIQSMLKQGVLFQGQKNKILEINCHNPREFATDKHRSVDGRPFGGGEGMVMKCEPLEKTYENIPKVEKKRFIYLSPQGQTLNAKKAQELSHYDQLIFLCGRYEGVDERFLALYVDEEISIGDYVLSGGELACAVVIDTVSRFYDGLLGNKDSSDKDTFQGERLKYSQYTRPANFKGLEVPAVLTSGDHKAVEEFRKHVSILRTHFKRPDLPQAPQDLDKAMEFYKKLSSKERKTLGLPEQAW